MIDESDNKLCDTDIRESWEDDFFSSHNEKKSKRVKKVQHGLGYDDSTHVPPSYLDEDVTIEEVHEGEGLVASKWDGTVGTSRDPYYMPTPGGYTFRDHTVTDSTVRRESGLHHQNQYSSFTPTAHYHDDATTHNGKKTSYEENRNRWDQTALNARRRDEHRTSMGVRLRSTAEIRREEMLRAEFTRLKSISSKRNGAIDDTTMAALIPDGYEIAVRPPGMEPAEHPNVPKKSETPDMPSQKSDAELLSKAQYAESSLMVGEKRKDVDDTEVVSKRIDVADIGQDLPKLTEEDYEFFGSLLKYKDIDDEALINKIAEWRKSLTKKDTELMSIGFDKVKSTGREKIHSQLIQYSEGSN